MRKDFAVTDPPRDPRWLIALIAGIPMLVTLGLMLTSIGRHPLQLPIAASIMAVFAIVFLVLGRAAKRRAIALDDGVLDVLATFYHRRISAQEFDLDKARVIDLREHKEWQPLWKTNGFAMPGLCAGWFRSRSLTKLFCLITDRQRVLLLPLRAGGAVLLSPQRPADLLDALRAR